MAKKEDDDDDDDEEDEEYPTSGCEEELILTGSDEGYIYFGNYILVNLSQN